MSPKVLPIVHFELFQRICYRVFGAACMARHHTHALSCTQGLYADLRKHHQSSVDITTVTARSLSRSLSISII